MILKTALVLGIIALVMWTYPHFVLGIGNIRLFNGTVPDVNRPAWMGNGTLVATITFHCNNGRCESGGWIPVHSPVYTFTPYWYTKGYVDSLNFDILVF